MQKRHNIVFLCFYAALCRRLYDEDNRLIAPCLMSGWQSVSRNIYPTDPEISGRIWSERAHRSPPPMARSISNTLSGPMFECSASTSRKSYPACDINSAASGEPQTEEGPNGLAGFKFSLKAHLSCPSMVFRPRLTRTSTICRR